MIEIRNKSDAELAYMVLRDADMCKRNPEATVSLKRNLRAYLNRPLPEGRTIYNDYDYHIGLYPLNIDCESIDEAKEWFEENEYIHYCPSPYDCTGQVFTRWYKLVHRSNDSRWWVYHATAMDV